MKYFYTIIKGQKNHISKLFERRVTNMTKVTYFA